MTISQTDLMTYGLYAGIAALGYLLRHLNFFGLHIPAVAGKPVASPAAKAKPAAVFAADASASSPPDPAVKLQEALLSYADHVEDQETKKKAAAWVQSVADKLRGDVVAGSK